MQPDPAALGFGRRLREERVRLGLNQVEFAKLAGTSDRSQLAYENGKTAPTTAYLFRLSDHGVDIGYLVTGLRTFESATEEQSRLFRMLSKLSERERRAVMSLITILSGEEADPEAILEQIQMQIARGAVAAFNRNSVENRRLRAIIADASVPEATRDRARAILGDEAGGHSLHDNPSTYNPPETD